MTAYRVTTDDVMNEALPSDSFEPITYAVEVCSQAVCRPELFTAEMKGGLWLAVTTLQRRKPPFGCSVQPVLTSPQAAGCNDCILVYLRDI